MDIITTIINSIPEPLATAILTALFTGIVVFLLQKRIENSFAQSLHEYQTKFSRTYPKTLDVLEIFIQKFNEFVSTYFVLISMVYMSIWTKNSSRSKALLVKEETDIVLDQIQKAILDCDLHFRTNRFYLPDDSVKELDETINKMNSLHTYLSHYVKKPDIDIRIFREYVRLLNKTNHAEFPDRKAFEKIDGTDENFMLKYMQLLDDSLKGLSEEIENHYKSVADIAAKK
jgi:hypothetical protein